MPQLDKETAARTAEAESGWGMLEGIYEVELTAVTDADKSGKPFVGKESGVPFWKWEVTFPDDANEGKYKRRKLWRQISLSENADGMRNEAFAAFGADTSTNTDDLIGRRCLVQVANREWNGQDQAEVQKFMPLASASKDTSGGTTTTKGKGAAKTTETEKALF